MDHRVYLKVKIKSLAAEAKIIRHAEQKHSSLRAGLADHRRGVVRDEARLTLLAYGFLRGTPYLKIESKCELAPDWSRVLKMVQRYGRQHQFGKETTTEFKAAKETELKNFDLWKSGKM